MVVRLEEKSLIDKGLVGVYSADISNEPSIKVAEALGFLPYKNFICLYK